MGKVIVMNVSVQLKDVGVWTCFMRTRGEAASVEKGFVTLVIGHDTTEDFQSWKMTRIRVGVINQIDTFLRGV